MTTEWFEKEAGSDFHVNQEDPGMILWSDGPPDWITVPDETGHGGRFRYTEMVVKPCPLSDHGEPSRHYLLEGTTVFCVECLVQKQFIWCVRR